MKILISNFLPRYKFMSYMFLLLDKFNSQCMYMYHIIIIITNCQTVVCTVNMYSKMSNIKTIFILGLWY